MERVLLAILALGCAVAVIAPDRTPVQDRPVTQKPAAPAPSATPALAGDGSAEIKIDRAPDGHFYVQGMVNGASIRFLVDTGATIVALRREDAQAAGLQFAAGDFTATGRGAGGAVALKPVKLNRLGIGAVEAHDVDAVVVDGALPVSLLGQSWLRRVGNVQISGDLMVLR